MMHHGNATQRRSSFLPARLAASLNAYGRTRTKETPLYIKALRVSVKEPFRTYIRKHAGFKLGKFALRIRSVQIRMTNESGPHGKPTFNCVFAIALDTGRLVVVEHASDSERAAYDLAIAIAERTVRRALDRRREQRRRSLATQDGFL